MTAPVGSAQPGLAPIEWGAERLRRVTRLGRWLAWIGVTASAVGFSLADPAILSLGAAFLGAAFVCVDVGIADRGGITPITFYAFSSSLTGVANFLGLRALNTPREGSWFIYASYEDLMLAATLAWFGAVLPVLGFWLVSRAGALGALYTVLPAVRGYIEPRRLLIWGTALSVAAMISRTIMPLDFLGTIGSTFYLVPHFVAFTLARSGAQRGSRAAIAVALLIATTEALRALLFAYLRSDIVLPFVAFTFGYVLGRRSLRALLSVALAPIWVVAIFFVSYFGSFGHVRGQSGSGVERLIEVQEYQERTENDPTGMRRQTVLARLSSFNQLSQVGRIVRETGYLDGETFEYLGFALIPRFLWPEKPLIAKGAWFAMEIGQAYVRPDGSSSNSVNMTVPGELYLNFGWLGVLLGGPFFGLFLALLWERTGFWDEQNNVLGGAFAFYLIWIGFGLAADLQIVVTLTAMYLLFVAARTLLPRPPTSARAMPFGPFPDPSPSRR